MKRRICALSVRQIILGISGAASFMAFLILWIVIGIKGNSQQAQQAAERWSAQGDVAQISCFFSPNAWMSQDTIENFRHTLDNALQEASIVQTSPNANARLWADAYSAKGKITLNSDRASLTAEAIGIGGDFFLFHPVRLLYGSYFSGNDLNQDYCVIDEDAAWQLFGSNDVAGMTVNIAGVPHMVTGVVRRDSGKLERAAGLDKTVVYVSYSTLVQYGTLTQDGSSNGINHYEIVMPNPVSQYAYNYIKENLGADEDSTEVVENSARYNLLNRLKVIGSFGTRSMNRKAIIYPYWENVARGYEDILALLTLLALIFLLYPVILVTVWLVIRWRHRSWTVKSVVLKLQDKWERYLERRREQRKGSSGKRKKGKAIKGKNVKEQDFVLEDLEEEDNE